VGQEIVGDKTRKKLGEQRRRSRSCPGKIPRIKSLSLEVGQRLVESGSSLVFSHIPGSHQWPIARQSKKGMRPVVCMQDMDEAVASGQ